MHLNIADHAFVSFVDRLGIIFIVVKEKSNLFITMWVYEDQSHIFRLALNKLVYF